MNLTWSNFLSFLSMSILAMPIAAAASPRCIMYLTGQHPLVPPFDQLQEVTHVALAFMGSMLFNDHGREEWPLFTTVDQVRSQFAPGTKVMVAIGGWGDTLGFSAAARNGESRRAFAENVARMISHTGADGVDVDWEYPGGNGEDYKKVPNDAKAWEIAAYPLLLAVLREALGPNKLISAAVPGLPRDMLAFTGETVPRIMQHLDFMNVMTYDLMNRRDRITRHHSDVNGSLAAVNAYIANGAGPGSLNLGFAFYVKYFRTQHDGCKTLPSPIGCPTLLLEDPGTGADLGRAGSFSWHDTVPQDLAESFNRALAEGAYDEQRGGYYYWDGQKDLWWTFDTADAMTRKFSAIVDKKRLGGVFAWGLGEDGPEYGHLRAVSNAVAMRRAARDEL